MADEKDIVERLRESAKAFRENTVYTGDGDAVRLGVQAAECEEAALRIEAQESAIERLAEALASQQAAAFVAEAQLSEARGEVGQIVAWLRWWADHHQSHDRGMHANALNDAADGVAAGQHKDGSHD